MEIPGQESLSKRGVVLWFGKGSSDLRSALPLLAENVVDELVTLTEHLENRNENHRNVIMKTELSEQQDGEAS